MRLFDHPGTPEEFAERLARRRKVLDLWGISGAKSLARTMRDELRASLMACIDCPEAVLCDSWRRKARPTDDPPEFCPARDALLRLRDAV